MGEVKSNLRPAPTVIPKWPVEVPRIAQIVHAPRRRYLLCVRIGRDSTFEQWFRVDRPRKWDLLVSYYILPDSGAVSGAEIVSIGGLSKFSAIKNIDDKDRTIFREYQSIWFLDDDIELGFDDVDVFFDKMRELDLSLAQPSLSQDSHRSFPITIHDADCPARYTNFVEIMMPAFSQDAFQRCIDTFDKSISGWGLDYVWPKLLGYPDRKIGIVDAVVAKHTKPIDPSTGAFYLYLRNLGVDPWVELEKLKEEFNISADAQPKTLFKIMKRRSCAVSQDNVEAIDELRRLYIDTMERMLVGMIYQDPSQEPWGAKVYEESLRENGRDWPALAHTMIGFKRLRNLRELTEKTITSNIPGDFIETGVWRGGACILMKAVLRAYGRTDRRVFVADSFEGLPKPDPRYLADRGDIHHSYKELAVSKEEVANNFARYDLLDEQVVFIKGWFKDTLQTAPIEKLAILRLDGDMYESTIVALMHLYPKLTKGGFCIVDDGNVPNCRAAITDFRRDHNISDTIVDIDGWGFYWQKT
jgi:hypothetical protein